MDIYTLRNSHGCEARITNYGGIVVSLTVPDKNGKLDDVVLGFDTNPEYEANSPYFGALIGRYGNRIAKGKFMLDGKEYSLPINDPPNSLHGGKIGFDKHVWQATAGSSEEGPTLTLRYVSKDGEEGYPGTLTVKAVYTLTNDNALKVAFEATTDAPTVLNLTNHSYFDLRGAGTKGDILNHEVTIPWLEVPAGGQDIHSSRRIAPGGGDAVRFHETHDVRGAHQRPRRATAHRPGRV